MLRRISLALLALSSLYAQFDSGQISGYVRDASQAIVSGATVLCINEGTREQRQSVTNQSGYYVFPNLPVGSYTISAEASGFKKTIQTQVGLSSAGKINVDLTMTVGALSESVEVKASTSQVQTETAQVGRTIETKQIQDLTLNGRNPIYLALLKPGVTGGSIGTFDPDSVSNGGFNINGGRADEYNVVVDGAIATRTRSSGSMLGAQDVDTVQEVQILTATYAAEYGRSSAGQIRFVTKSGTQAFHGDLVENFRNSALDANDWTRNHSPDPSQYSGAAPFRFNQFGFDVGGPVFIPKKFNHDRSKLFFFYADEWIRRRQDDSQTGTVPSAAIRGGDLSNLLDPANPFFRRTRAANDPLNGNAPFPNNVIPAARISPNGRALLNSYPQPTPGFQQGTSNWFGSLPRASDTRKDTVKVDYLLNDK